MFDETKVLIAAIVCVTAVGIAFDDEPNPCTTYNEMRAIWDESGHEYGWPEYEPGKDKECGYES